MLPNPSLVNAPDGNPSGSRIDTVDFGLRFNLVLLFARDRAGEFVRIPPGDGSAAIRLSEFEVCSSDVEGSKYAS